jgi:hypothetical protein
MKRKKRIFTMSWGRHEECRRSDVKLILGDFIAKVACEDENENIGKYDLH